MSKRFIVFLCLCLILACCGICDSDIGADSVQLYVEQHPGVLPYDGIWIADGGSMRIEIACRQDCVEILVFQMIGELEWTSWEYLAEYEERTGVLKSLPETGLKSWNRGDTDGNILESVYEYDDGAAVFSLNEEGELLWKEEKEDADAGFIFKGIGSFGGKYLSDRVRISMVWNQHEANYDVDVSIREDSVRTREWVMKGIYHPETRTLSAAGASTLITHLTDGTIDLDANPESGEVSAEFSFDSHFRLLIRSAEKELEGISFEHVFVPLWLWDL